MQADARFFTDLVQRLRPILEAKGFRLTRHVYMPKSFGHRIATFEGPAFIVDAAWEGRDREILLLQRELDQSNVSAGDHLAEAHIPQGASSEVYARATGYDRDGRRFDRAQPNKRLKLAAPRLSGVVFYL